MSNPITQDAVAHVAFAVREIMNMQHGYIPHQIQSEEIAQAALAATQSLSEWRDISELADEPEAVFGYWTRTGDRKSWVQYSRRSEDRPSAATHFFVLPDPPGSVKA